jgi:hypothetical protein
MLATAGLAEDTDRYCSDYQSVANSVGVMTASRLAYDDPSTPAEMGTDALATLTALGWLPSSYVPRESTKRGEIEIPEATARLAAAMNLQLDGE